MVLDPTGAVWICDPFYVDNDSAEILWGTEVAGEPTTSCSDLADLATCTVTATSEFKAIVPGCMETSP